MMSIDTAARYGITIRNRGVTVGQRVSCYPYIGIDGTNEPKAGTVTYVHPEHRYYTVALDEGYDQSFPWTWLL